MKEALAFLTPVGGAKPPSAKAFSWFPLAGVVIGAAVGGVWWAAAQIWPPAVAAAVAVAADVALTGMLHLDGLIDTADGLLPHLPVERRLAVMAAPDVGAFGVAVAAAVFLLRWSALGSLPPSVAVIAGLWCLSRSAMAVIAMVLPYARSEGGLATAFLGPGRISPWRPAVIGGGALVIAIVLSGVGPALAGAVAAALVAAFARRRIGGFTGDVLGAAGVIAETVGLLVAAAR